MRVQWLHSLDLLAPWEIFPWKSLIKKKTCHCFFCSLWLPQLKSEYGLAYSHLKATPSCETDFFKWPSVVGKYIHKTKIRRLIVFVVQVQYHPLLLSKNGREGSVQARHPNHIVQTYFTECQRTLLMTGSRFSNTSFLFTSLEKHYKLLFSSISFYLTK